MEDHQINTVLSDPVKALIMKQLDLKGLNMKEVSLGIGRNETYLHQFITKGFPKKTA